MKNISNTILWATIEDFVGLWEINWEINTLQPENTNIQNRELAKKIIKYFLDSSFVKFYFNKWGKEDLIAISYSEATAVLENEIFWEAPAIDDTCIKIGCTKEGESYYNQ